jgi:hypothetical protein
MTVGDYLNRWLEGSVYASALHSTFDRYETVPLGSYKARARQDKAQEAYTCPRARPPSELAGRWLGSRFRQ